MCEVKMYKNGDHVPAGMENEAYNQMTDKQDFVDNAIFTLMTTLAEKVGKKAEWNMSSIAEIRETVLDELAEAGIFVPYPGLEEIDDDDPNAGSIWREYECDPEDYEDDEEDDDDGNVSVEELQSIIDNLSHLTFNINAVTTITKALCKSGLIQAFAPADYAADKVFAFLVESDLEELQNLKAAFITRPNDFKYVFKNHIAITVKQYYSK